MDKLWRNVMVTALLLGGLAFTYDKCIWCVVGIAMCSLFFSSCIPMMPLVFMISCIVLIMHAVDYHNATIKVEVPLENIVYIPNWDDIHKYVHVNPIDSETKM